MQVAIAITRRTQYATTVEMDQSTYDALNTKLNSETMSERRAAQKEINSMIDSDDWQDDDFHSVDEFEPYAS